MTSSQKCAVQNCQLVSRCFCDHCKTSVCRLHLNEHAELLLKQLPSLNDEAKLFDERV